MEYDFIVVGAGSAGCPVARRLSDSGLRVLLIEAGGSDRHPFVAIPGGSILAIASRRLNWMFEVEPDPSRDGRVDQWPAGRCFGGSSAINGMMFVRGHPWDYDHWASLGCTGWDYQSVLPYFKRLEDNSRGADEYRGVGGPAAVCDTRVPNQLTGLWVDAMINMGIPRCPDLNGAVPDGVDLVQASQKNGWRQTTGSAFVRPALRKNSLKLELHSEVHRVLFSGGRATGVEYCRKGKMRTEHARLGVVLAAGTMVSPTLLQRSGVGDAALLESLNIPVIADSPGVGKNLQDHPGVMLSYNINLPTFGSDSGPLRSLLHGLNFIFRGRGPLTTSIGHAQAFIRTLPHLERPNVQLITAPFAYDFDEKGAKLVRERAFGMAVGLMRPRPRGTIRLRSADYSVRPLIQHEMLGSSDDVDEIVAGVKFARELMQKSPIESVVVSERFPGKEIQSDQELESFIRQTAFSMYHQIGTCKMGTDELAVVDPDLRVRGVSGLWVADASIMPTLPSGNANATCIMIGEKAADLVSAAI